MSAYNFTPKGAFFINYKEPDRETVDHITSLYYLIIGSLATITQTAIKDLHDNLSERKDLFKHELKYRIKEAFSRSETLIGIFKKYTTEISQYELWLDITDSMEEDLKIDIQRLFYTTDNILLKNNIKEHKLQAYACVAYNLSIMLHDMCTKFDDVMSERGISSGSIRPCGEFIQSMYGMYASMREVARILIPDKDAEYFKEGGQIYRALQVVAMKVCNPEG